MARAGGLAQGQGLTCYSELIWGTPGETCESFLDGYAALSEHVSRIAIYPLLIMPNTGYSEQRDQHGFVLLRGEHDDFAFAPSPREVTLYFREGFATHIDNHEFVSRYVGRTRAQIEAERPSQRAAQSDHRLPVPPASVS